MRDAGAAPVAPDDHAGDSVRPAPVRLPVPSTHYSVGELLDFSSSASPSYGRRSLKSHPPGACRDYGARTYGL